MTKKNRPQKISWTPNLNFAFRALKESLLTSSVLLCPDYGKPFLVQTDASHHGVGAVLSQQDEKGIKRPVAFYSRKLLPRELNYSAMEKECLAIVNSLRGSSPWMKIHCPDRPPSSTLPPTNAEFKLQVDEMGSSTITI